MGLDTELESSLTLRVNGQRTHPEVALSGVKHMEGNMGHY